MFTTIVECPIVEQNLDSRDWIIVDCRFSLADIEAGHREYASAHLPGAVYAHLNQDLSGPPTTDNGRHPLPSPAAMTALFGQLGIDNEKQVVVYDDQNGAIASRLWWMLQYMSHEAVAVLNGGWQAWQAAGFRQRAGTEENPPVLFEGSPRREMLVTLDDISESTFLIDSRAPERYRGEVEPIDSRAGHIPGATNHFYKSNWDQAGYYLPAEELKTSFHDLLGEIPVESAAFYCGSGVTACANLLALAHAGFGLSRLYVGSWSEWSSVPERPAAGINET